MAADVLVMASLAQVAGQYVFLLFRGQQRIGQNAASGWVLLVGILWIVAMTAICYVGIEVSANFQKVLLSIELVMLLVLSVTALGQGRQRLTRRRRSTSASTGLAEPVPTCRSRPSWAASS